MNKIKMIVGLSNPKIDYHHTRHNVGSWYIYHIAQYFCKMLHHNKKFSGFTTSFYIKSHYIRLFVPNIFMNINGKSVFKIASFYNIHLNEILIVHDDLEIEPGIAKIKYSYGHNGHNGLRSVISFFDKKINFYRFRIGIGRPKNKDEIASFVLSMPTRTEKILITESIFHAVEKTLTLII